MGREGEPTKVGSRRVSGQSPIVKNLAARVCPYVVTVHPGTDIYSKM